MSRAIPKHRTGRRILAVVLDPKGVQWKGVVIPEGELIVSSPRGTRAHHTRWMLAGRITNVVTPDSNTAGLCKVCHCTYADACPGGCSWANDERTLCSACV